MALVDAETPLEAAIVATARWHAGALWGEPRSGHPEGAVIRHIEAVLANVGSVALDGDDRSRLRLVALVHDTFKREVDRSRPVAGENEHAMIARRYAEEFVTDVDVLDTIELHDEGYRAWRVGDRGDWPKATSRPGRLLDRLATADRIGFHLRFYQADNQVEGKQQDNFDWYQGLARARLSA
jgi:hypothetical protein